MAAIDRDAPLRFLHTAYQPNDWVAVFLKSYETGQTAQRVRPVARVADARFQAWLRWRNFLRWNVYLSLNAVAPDRRSRTRDAVVAVRHVFLEIDRDGPQTLAAIAARNDLPPPSYVLESSPNRFHVFWRVSGFTTDAVEALQKQLANDLRADPAATPCTQTTRLPGFVNHKGQPHVLTIEYRDVIRVYTPADFPVAISQPTVARPVRRTQRVAPSLDRIERARRYLMAVPPAIAGQHGDLHTFQVCCRMVRGFALSDIDAFALLVDWNTRCEPPWSEPELRDKVRRARRYGREPIGGLLSEDDQVTGVM
jgi:hypothetical protein